MSYVVYFTEDIQTPVKTILPAKTSSSLSVQHPNVLPQGNAHLGRPQSVPQGRGFTSRSLGSLWQFQQETHAGEWGQCSSTESGEQQEPFPSSCCRAGSSDSPRVLIKSQDLGEER